VGFLNFIPKWERGNVYGVDREGRTTLTVDAGEQSGSLVAELVGDAGRLHVTGSFVCGPLFSI
jgi:hypothetical protein